MTSPWPACVHDADPTTCDACYAEDAHWAPLAARPERERLAALQDDLDELAATDAAVARAADRTADFLARLDFDQAAAERRKRARAKAQRDS